MPALPKLVSGRDPEKPSRRNVSVAMLHAAPPPAMIMEGGFSFARATPEARQDETAGLKEDGNESIC